MTTIGMVLVVLMLAYGIYFVCTHLEKEEKNGKKELQKDGNKWAEILPGYLGRTVEIVVKAPLFGIGVIHSQKGILQDLDGQWLEMVCEEKKKKVTKMIRLDQISAVKEIHKTVAGSSSM